MKAKLLLLLALLLPAVSAAQNVDEQKVAQFATAVAHAEGFGVRHAIPTRYHNPGDITSRRDLTKLPGQRALGKRNHIVFASDAAGWAALHDYINKMVDGRSRRYNPNMTLTRVAQIYVGDKGWRPWIKTVCRELNVTPTTKLRDLLYEEEPVAPRVIFTEYQLPNLGTNAPVQPVLVTDNDLVSSN